MKRLSPVFFLVATACASSQPHPANVVDVAVPQMPKASPERAPSAPTAVVVVHATSSASRSPEHGRILRRLLAERHGRLQIAQGYGALSLIIDKIESGTLDDPDYPKRPIGVNVLPVVLTDEAAWAAPDGLDGFEGSWRLTRARDGSLVASSIGDTPFDRARVGSRQEQIEKARAQLRAQRPDEIRRALEFLDHHSVFDLVPDLLPLLDAPAHQMRALMTLARLFEPIADERTPNTFDRSEWDAYWKGLLERPPELPKEIGVVPTELLRLATSQTSAELTASNDGVLAIAISGMGADTPIDGHRTGIFLGNFDTAKNWIVTDKAHEAVDIATTPTGYGVLHATVADGHWFLDIVPKNLHGKQTVDLGVQGTHAAIAAGPRGFFLIWIKEGSKSLFGMPLDASGHPHGAPKEMKLPGAPGTQYHRGVHPIALVSRNGGWTAAVELGSQVHLASFDDAFKAKSIVPIGGYDGIAQPKMAVRGDNVLVVWTTREKNTRLAWAIADRNDTDYSAGKLGSEVDSFAQPVALEDGYAIPWIEGGAETHVGRIDGTGEHTSSVLVQAKDTGYFALALSRQGKDLVVANEDRARYPFRIVARKFDPSLIREEKR